MTEISILTQRASEMFFMQTCFPAFHMISVLTRSDAGLHETFVLKRGIFVAMQPPLVIWLHCQTRGEAGQMSVFTVTDDWWQRETLYESGPVSTNAAPTQSEGEMK